MLRVRVALLICVVIATLAGCGHSPPRSDSVDPRTSRGAPSASPAAQDAALTALTLIGTPYRFGGASPNGFDCSGLVQYSYSVAGMKVPRDTKQQKLASQRLDPTESLAPGDLLFFNIGSPTALHVGLFVGNGDFVHAPAQGGRVRIERLESHYWRRHFIEARRL